MHLFRRRRRDRHLGDSLWQRLLAGPALETLAIRLCGTGKALLAAGSVAAADMGSAVNVRVFGAKPIGLTISTTAADLMVGLAVPVATLQTARAIVVDVDALAAVAFLTARTGSAIFGGTGVGGLPALGATAGVVADTLAVLTGAIGATTCSVGDVRRRAPGAVAFVDGADVAVVTVRAGIAAAVRVGAATGRRTRSIGAGFAVVAMR